MAFAKTIESIKMSNLNIDYSTLFFFERGEWWDYLMLILVIAGLAGVAWLIQRYKLAVLVFFVILPLGLTIFWWPYSTVGTASAGWFPIVKQYSALIGSLSLVALQYFPKLRQKYWYLCLPPLILAVNILEAVIRDLQCAGLHGMDAEGVFILGGPWNVMNAIAGILNILMISGWVGIYIAKGPSKAIVWGDLTLAWIIAYDLWNLAYVYNCLPDRAWYSGVALLASCTIPAFMKIGRGAWIQYRAYTLTLWSAVVLTFPQFTQSSIFAHRASYNETALLLLSGAAIAFNLGLFGYHIYRIYQTRRNPFTQELYVDTTAGRKLIAETAGVEVKAASVARNGLKAELFE